MKPFENPYKQMTPVKNIVFDYIMPSLSPNAWKVLCVVIRQTWGWADDDGPAGRKLEDELSYSQLLEKTGIGGRSTLSRALQECLELGYLLRRKVGQHQGTRKPIYAYRLNIDLELASPKTGLAASPEMGPVASPKTGLTKQSKTNKQNGDGVLSEDEQTSLALLQDAGINGAGQFLAYSSEHVKSLLAYADTHNLGPGWIAERLRENDWTPPKPQRPKTAEEMSAERLDRLNTGNACIGVKEVCRCPKCAGE